MRSRGTANLLVTDAITRERLRLIDRQHRQHLNEICIIRSPVSLRSRFLPVIKATLTVLQDIPNDPKLIKVSSPPFAPKRLLQLDHDRLDVLLVEEFVGGEGAWLRVKEVGELFDLNYTFRNNVRSSYSVRTDKREANRLTTSSPLK